MVQLINFGKKKIDLGGSKKKYIFFNIQAKLLKNYIHVLVIPITAYIKLIITFI